MYIGSLLSLYWVSYHAAFAYLGYASVRRSLLLLNRSISRSFLTLVRTSDTANG